MLTRAHEWLADRISWVQYPRVRRVVRKPPFWRYQMAWPLRAFLILLGVVLIAACAVAAFFLLVLFWATFTA